MLYLLPLISLLASAVAASDAAFDWSLGNATVALLDATYCDNSTYMTREYDGYAQGFVPTRVIYNELYDINGVVGHREQDQTIYVAVRGTQSRQGWDDHQVGREPYTACDGGEVHQGFYQSYALVAEDVVGEVVRLLMEHPTFSVVVTGHSVGGAVATLAAVDIILNGIPVTLITFGSPRIFNAFGAQCVSDLLNNIVPLPPLLPSGEGKTAESLFSTGRSFRVTHPEDAAVHTPVSAEGFVHVSGEWYESEATKCEDSQTKCLLRCEGYEDPQCASQGRDGVMKSHDHMRYLSVRLGCDTANRINDSFGAESP